MHHDDDLDDFSHLPSVDAAPSAEDRTAIWKQHSRKQAAPVAEPQPEHSVHDEILEAQLIAHELPVEQEFIAEEHPSHTPDWAEEAYVTQEAPAEAEPAIEPPGEVQDWVRETFQLSAEEPAKKKRRDPELHSPSILDRATLAFLAHQIPLEEPRSKNQTPRNDAPPSAGPEPKAASAKVPISRENEPPKAADEHTEDKHSEEAHHTGPPPVPHIDEPELTPRERFRQTWEKIGGRALTASVTVHVVFLIIAALVIVTIVPDKQVDFLPGGGSKGANEAAQSKQFKVQQKKNTWLKNKPLKRVVSTNISPNLTLPEVPPDLDFPDATKLIGSKNMSGGGFGGAGIGKGFGSGMGFGGKINFMGNTGVGRNIVFVVDVSASMSAQGDSGTGNRISRFDLLKRELSKTIGRLPPNTQFQVLFFSDFAWPHNEVDSKNLQAFDKYAWTISPDKTGGRVPQFRYITANSTTVASSIQIILDSDNPGGTNWGSGLFMALKAFPKPDVVFFMTDGNKADSVGWVDAVTKLNLTGGKRTIIHTTAMMEPDAAEELDQLAKRNGGSFTIVTATGFTLTSEDYFKGRK